MSGVSYEVKDDGKVYVGERFLADIHRLQGWKTLSNRQVGIWAGTAHALSITDFSLLIECSTAQWWLALCEQDGGRGCVKSHVERLAASYLRFRDWAPASNKELLDRDMTANNRWGRALNTLNSGGVHYVQQLACLSDEVLLDNVDGLRLPMIAVARHALANSQS